MNCSNGMIEKVGCLVVIMLILFCSCGHEPEEVSSLDEKESSLVVSHPSSESVPEDTKESIQEDTPQELPSESSEDEPQSVAEMPSSIPEQSAASQLIITVQPISMMEQHDPFSITDPDLQKQILDFLTSMQPRERLQDPPTGGSHLELTITEEGVVQTYTLLGHTDDDGNLHVSKDGQLYVTDFNLWRTVVSMYPLFDYENNQPLYMIDVQHIAKNSSIGMSYFEAGKAIWSETEQERTTQILGYINAMVPIQNRGYDELNASDAIRIYIYDMENQTSKLYLCLNFADSNGNCLIKYEGQSGDDGNMNNLKNGGRWFAADSECYSYMNRFWS